MQSSFKEIRDLMGKFQQGYQDHDPSKLDAFITDLFTSDANVLIVGTGSSEWMEGPQQIKDLVKNDWKEWKNLEVDIDQSHIHVEGNTAWVTTTAVCDVNLQIDNLLEFGIQFTKNQLEQAEMSASMKLASILPIISQLLYEEQRGHIFKYPLRISAYLVNRKNGWKIHHMHFSFPNSFIPDGRITT